MLSRGMDETTRDYVIKSSVNEKNNKKAHNVIDWTRFTATIFISSQFYALKLNRVQSEVDWRYH